MREQIEKLTLKHRRPDVFKLLKELGCEFKGIDYVLIDDLVIDQGIYPREKTDWERVEMYAENLENGDVFPPILVTDERKLILDGNHRYYAHKKAEKSIVWIEKWDVPEALFPIVAQAVNTEEKETDTPLTPTEKKKAILRDWDVLTQYPKDERKKIIAQIVKTTISYVNKVLAEAGIIKSEKEELRKKAKKLKDEGYTQEEIAEELGVSVRTIRNWFKKEEEKIYPSKNFPVDPTHPDEPDSKTETIPEVVRNTIYVSYLKGTSLEEIQNQTKEYFKIELTLEQIQQIIEEEKRFHSEPDHHSTEPEPETSETTYSPPEGLPIREDGMIDPDEMVRRVMAGYEEEEETQEETEEKPKKRNQPNVGRPREKCFDALEELETYANEMQALTWRIVSRFGHDKAINILNQLLYQVEKNIFEDIKVSL